MAILVKGVRAGKLGTQLKFHVTISPTKPSNLEKFKTQELYPYMFSKTLAKFHKLMRSNSRVITKRTNLPFFLPTAPLTVH